MKLILNPPSPYARKVVVMAHELAVAERLDVVALDPWTDPPTLIDVTPLCRVPGLADDRGATAR